MITVGEAAEQSGYSYQNIVTMAIRGLIASRKRGGRRLISATSLAAYLDRMQRGQRALRRAKARLLRECQRDIAAAHREAADAARRKPCQKS